MKIFQRYHMFASRKRRGVVLAAIFVLSFYSIANNNFLSEYEDELSRTESLSRRALGRDAIQCKKIQPAHRPSGNGTRPVFAASYPGSGSKMLWNIIEGLTELWTGDEWFQNGRNLPNEVVSVKTHYPQSNGREIPWKDMVDRAILLLRSPLHAIPSYHNYVYEYDNKLAPHSTRAPTEEWIKWRDNNFEKELAAWETHLRYWVDKFGVKENSSTDDNNLLIITYEDIVTGPEEIREISEFLKPVLSVNSPECIYDAVVHYKDKKSTNINTVATPQSQAPLQKEPQVVDDQGSGSLVNHPTSPDEKQSLQSSTQEPDLFNDGSVTNDKEQYLQRTNPDVFRSNPNPDETTSKGSYQTQEQDLKGNDAFLTEEGKTPSDEAVVTSNEDSNLFGSSPPPIDLAGTETVGDTVNDVTSGTQITSSSENKLPFDEQEQSPQIVSSAPIMNEVQTPDTNQNFPDNGIVSEGDASVSEELQTTQEDGLEIAHRTVDGETSEQIMQVIPQNVDSSIANQLIDEVSNTDVFETEPEVEVEDVQNPTGSSDSNPSATESENQPMNDSQLKISGEAVLSSENNDRFMTSQSSNGEELRKDPFPQKTSATETQEENEQRSMSASPSKPIEARPLNYINSNQGRAWSIPPPEATQVSDPIKVVRRTKATLHDRMMEGRNGRKLQEVMKEQDDAGTHLLGIGGSMFQQYVQQDQKRTLEGANVASDPHSLRSGHQAKPYTVRELGMVLDTLRRLHRLYRHNDKLSSVLFDYADEVLGTVPDNRKSS
jgi:hypothetical protein